MKPRSPRSASVVCAALASAALASYLLAAGPGCDGEGSSRQRASDPTTLVSDAGSFTRSSLLAAFGQCALDGYRKSAQKSALLAEAVRRHESEQSAASLTAARTAFADAMVDYQRIEIMQFGPFAKKVAPGGEGLRDLVYAWPNVNRCLVDEALVARGYEAADFAAKGAVNVRGLAAVEYLLWSEGATNACADTSAINAGGTWQALEAGELSRRRAAYARVLVEDVAARLGGLVQKWEPGGGNFLAELESAGTGSRHYGSQQLALNSVMDALFYVDVELKDEKVGRPLALTGSCTTDCSDQVEALQSKLGRAHVTANLAGFRAIFFGCGEGGAGLGFDDLLEGVGAARVATSVHSALAEVDAALSAIPEQKLEDELRAQSTAARALHEALRKLGGLLKTEVVTVLNLELPGRVEGDND